MKRCMILAAVVGLAMLTGCDQSSGGSAGQQTTTSSPTAPLSSEQRSAESFTGTLEGDIAAIGGETTGWALVSDGRAGSIEVDVRRIRPDAEQLEGQRVTIHGNLIKRHYTERGAVTILVAKRIEPAPRNGR